LRSSHGSRPGPVRSRPLSVKRTPVTSQSVLPGRFYDALTNPVGFLVAWHEAKTDYLLHGEVLTIVQMYISYSCVPKLISRLSSKIRLFCVAATILPSDRHTAEVESGRGIEMLTQSKESNVAHVTSLARKWRENRPGRVISISLPRCLTKKAGLRRNVRVKSCKCLGSM
jgi:hypothetical protein